MPLQEARTLSLRMQPEPLMSPTIHLFTGAYLLVAQASVLLAAAAYTYWRDFGPKPRVLVVTQPAHAEQTLAHA